MSASSTYAGKSLHITGASALPPHKIKSIAAWGGKVIFRNMEFRNWKAKTKLGMRNTIFAMNFKAADYIPMHQFYNTKFINVEGDALGYIMDPSPGWANVKDCGNFPCTAPWNVLFSFKKNTF